MKGGTRTFDEKLQNSTTDLLRCYRTSATPRYSHPWYAEADDGPLGFIEGSHVTADSGTGIVHTAPAHGTVRRLAVMFDCCVAIGCMMRVSLFKCTCWSPAGGAKAWQCVHVLRLYTNFADIVWRC